MPTLPEQLLAAFCKSPEDVPYDDPSDSLRLASRDAPVEPLGNLQREFSNLGELLRGKDVLDFGCGFGDQAGAIAKAYGARVTGLDSHLGVLAAARSRYGANARFVNDLGGETFDVVISQDAMEHFSDPEAALAAMARALRPNGQILMTFGPPWYAPYGSHTGFFCPIPWVQLWFSEKTVMAVRARYRKDGATRYEEVESGLNKMSLRKFERVVAQSGLMIDSCRYVGVKKMHWLTRIPLVRELTTVVVTAILRH
jgi:ubiquinone/menaquinone biosynthesis C-methylase UbiE